MLRMSSLNRIVNCSGSLSAEAESAEGKNSEWSLFGNHGHLCMEACVNKREVAIIPSDTVKVEELEKHIIHNWQLIENIVKDNGGWDKAAFVNTEKEVVLTLSSRADKGKETFKYTGHSDLVMYFPEKARVIVVDYKFGGGFVPQASRNYQLAGYGLAAWQGMDLENEPVEEVEIHLMSVGVGHSSFRFDPTEADQMHDFLYNATIRARQEDSPRQLGPECKYCRALMTTKCPETALLHDAVAKFDKTPNLMTIELARKIMSVKDALSQGMKMAEQMIRDNLKAGGEDPDYFLGKATVKKKITDLEGMAAAAENAGCLINRVPKVTLGDIEKQLMTTQGITKQQAKAYIEEHMTSHYTLTETARPLKRR